MLEGRYPPEEIPWLEAPDQVRESVESLIPCCYWQALGLDLPARLESARIPIQDLEMAREYVLGVPAAPGARLVPSLDWPHGRLVLRFQTDSAIYERFDVVLGVLFQSNVDDFIQVSARWNFLVEVATGAVVDSKYECIEWF